jgi:hypothetical protein
MTKSRRRTRAALILVNPFAASMVDITLKSSEIALASGQTILHRTSMI